MQTKYSNYEYGYSNNNSGHHHAYLLSPLLEMISQARLVNQEKVRILDIGCGNGSLSNLIAQQGYEVVGVEESKSGVTNARLSFPSCHFIQASIYDLPSDLLGAFDIVISVEVIEHLLYPRELVRAAEKCLKPNGCLIITTPYHGYLKNLVIAGLGKMDKHFNPLWDGGHVKFFSVPTLTNLFESEGFTKIKFKFAGRVPYLWKAMICSSYPVSSTKD